MKLPPIPNGNAFAYYTVEQMREYAAAAYRAGQEEMRERGANEIMNHASERSARYLASLVRALPVLPIE